MDVKNLVNKFASNVNHYKSSQYNEAQLRTDFLDPFFSMLGWDISNSAGSPTNIREVLVEEALKTSKSQNTKKPDYTFRLFSERKFFVEAKKPSVDINTAPDPARQVRRYGFTAKLKISVLSNFEYLAIYDCSQTVSTSDAANHSRIKLWHYSEFLSCFEEIKSLIGKEAIYSGRFDIEWKDIAAKIERFSVDNLFLEQINKWRLKLAKNFINIRSDLSDLQLNDLTQAYINSIVFLRVCEDRDLEVYESLLQLSSKEDYATFKRELALADKKYNSGLFDLPHAADFISDQNSYLWQIIKELYYPQSTYSFSVFSSDILGNIYEVFLGEKLQTINGQISLVAKDENVDRDVVTTPTHIIRDILSVSVLIRCKKLTANEILGLKFADIACGSGAFLLETFQLLQDILVDYYVKENETTNLVPTSYHTYKLTFDVKKKLLTNCIYGVDKDFNAVNAARFGLLLKLLEGESNLSISIPALPKLDCNIIFGNTLITPQQAAGKASININPYDFGNIRFDVIVGNPPYLSTENMKDVTPDEYDIYKDVYKTAYRQFDKYYLFIERAMQLLNTGGDLGYIVPSKFMKTGSGKELRGFIANNQYLFKLVTFGANQIFKNKTTYTCLLFLKKKVGYSIMYQEAKSLESWKVKKRPLIVLYNYNVISDSIWTLGINNLDILNALRCVAVNLSTIVGKASIANGIQTSANKVYIHKPLQQDNDFMYFEYGDREYKIEKELTRPYFETPKGNKVDTLHSYIDVEPNAFVIYPYRIASGKIELIALEEIEDRYPFLFQFLNVIKPVLADPKRSIKPTPTNPDEWHRYGRSHGLSACDSKTKIVVGVLSAGYKYAIDRKQTFVSSGGTAGYCPVKIPESCPYSEYYIQALLNSKYCEWYVTQHGEINRGNYVSRGTKIIERLPIVPINFEQGAEKSLHDKIATLQMSINETYTAVRANAGDQRAIIPLERSLEMFQQQMSEALKALFSLGELDDLIPSVEVLYGGD